VDDPSSDHSWLLLGFCKRGKQRYWAAVGLVREENSAIGLLFCSGSERESSEAESHGAKSLPAPAHSGDDGKTAFVEWIEGGVYEIHIV